MCPFCASVVSKDCSFQVAIVNNWTAYYLSVTESPKSAVDYTTVALSPLGNERRRQQRGGKDL